MIVRFKTVLISLRAPVLDPRHLLNSFSRMSLTNITVT